MKLTDGFDPISKVPQVSFSYETRNINELSVVTTQPEDAKKKPIPVAVRVGDREVPVTARFWGSLFSRYGFGDAFFKYFDYDEVFNRIAQVSKDKIRICFEHSKDQEGNDATYLLAVSNPNKPVMPFEEIMGLIVQSGGTNIRYNNGIFESLHKPSSKIPFSIGGDEFLNMFMLSTPIDGYGDPSTYLAMLRMICSNGTIALNKSFRSSLAMGKKDDNVLFSITRALDQFSNEEGYSALRQRMESATTSWASVHEALGLYELLAKLLNGKNSRLSMENGPANGGFLAETMDQEVAVSPFLTGFHKLTGDMSELYGLANMDALSAKRQRSLPVRCKVYDLVNYATEVATHYSCPASALRLNSWVGNLLTSEFDMEGTALKHTDFADFHISSKLSSGMTGSHLAV